MSDATDYVPPKVWTWAAPNGGQFASINRPVAGATHEQALPVGRHPLQLYSLATPNGVKVTVMLEELLALGHAGAEYGRLADTHRRRPAVRQWLCRSEPEFQDPGAAGPQRPEAPRVFESGAILLHLAQRFNALLPADPAQRTECLSWLFWQMGSAPYLGGGFGHFYAYAPAKFEYAINRFAMEAKRQLDGWTAAWPKCPGWPAMSTPLPTSRCGPGTACWP